MCKLKVTTHTANNDLLSHRVVPPFKNGIAENNNSVLLLDNNRKASCSIY